MPLTHLVSLENSALVTDLYHFRIENQILLASWADSLSVESEAFLESMKSLFRFAATGNVKKVYLDCGVPAGGTLTEPVINFVLESIGGLGLVKLAVLETVDFHWDNNLLQFLHYLKDSVQASVQIRFFSLEEQALEWLASR